MHCDQTIASLLFSKRECLGGTWLFAFIAAGLSGLTYAFHRSGEDTRASILLMFASSMWTLTFMFRQEYLVKKHLETPCASRLRDNACIILTFSLAMCAGYVLLMWHDVTSLLLSPFVFCTSIMAIWYCRPLLNVQDVQPPKKHKIGKRPRRRTR